MPTVTTPGRQQPQLLLPKASKYFPVELRVIVIKILRHLEPYEDYVTSIDLKKRRDEADLMNILMEEGVFSQEFFTLTRSFSERYVAFKYEIEGRLQRAGRSVAVMTRELEKLAQAMDACVFRPVAEDRRPLASFILRESALYTFILDVVAFTRKFGPYRTLNYVHEHARYSGGNPQIAILERWFQVAFRLRDQPAPVFDDHTKAEARALFRVLKEMDFEITDDREVPFAVPPGYEQFATARRSTNLGSFSTVGAYSLLTFEILPATTAIAPIGWHLSRLTGEITVFGLHSLREVFKLVGAESHYEALRVWSIKEAAKALLDGRLKERVYIGTSSFAARYREIVPTSPPAPVPPPVALTPTEPVDEYDPLSDEVFRAREFTRRELRPHEVSWGQLTHRKVMAALRRCGVQVEFSHHPMLIYKGRRCRYLNPHESDPSRNEIVIYDALDKLGITEAEFLRNL